MAITTPEILELFETYGKRMYGREPINQIDHALQCATLAEQAGATPELISASLLHDLGHLLAVHANVAPPAPNTTGHDDMHQYFALPFLRGLLPDAVLEPIRLHVDAKRYLCHAEPGYWDTLSDESKHSLVVQGGVHNAKEAAGFIGKRHAADAVLLRRWDDLAKVPGRETPPIDYFARILGACSHA